LDHGHGPLESIKRYSLTQLLKFAKAAEKRDRQKQAALIEACMLGQDPKVAAAKIKELLGQNGGRRDKNNRQHKRNRKRSA
jgi:hypothetical protein